jgi:hypothetical protein
MTTPAGARITDASEADMTGFFVNVALPHLLQTFKYHAPIKWLHRPGIVGKDIFVAS